MFLVIKIAIEISQIVYFILFARNSLIATFLRNKLSFTYFWGDKFCSSCRKVYLSFSAYEIICKRHVTSVHCVSYIILQPDWISSHTKKAPPACWNKDFHRKIKCFHCVRILRHARVNSPVSSNNFIKSKVVSDNNDEGVFKPIKSRHFRSYN